LAARKISILGWASRLKPSTITRSTGSSRASKLGQRWLGRAAQLAHQRPALGGGDQHLPRPGQPMGVAVLARLVDIEGMVCVLDGGNADTPRIQGGNQPGQ
jgi:hypothetical protein